MTSTILFSSPVPHHLSSPHNFPDPYKIRNEREISIESVVTQNSNEFFNRTLSSIIRNKQVIETIGHDTREFIDSSNDCETGKKSPMSSDVSTHSNEKFSPESSQVSAINEQTSNDSNSDQFNNSVSSTSSINNNSQNSNKLQKLKKK